MLIEENLIDQTFIDSRTNDWQATRELAAKYSPDVASQICGAGAEDRRRGAAVRPREDVDAVMHARGIEHHTNGVNNVLSYINLVLATGKIGAPVVATERSPVRATVRWTRAWSESGSTSRPTLDNEP